ncbi:hypothetical protein ABEW32_15435 [Paenibacillus jamilae]|uniref:hypothetical protein n=1 Tax=Paenibacillus jamilae TaxID=114136 RepID=UPI003D2A92C0
MLTIEESILIYIGPPIPSRGLFQFGSFVGDIPEFLEPLMQVEEIRELVVDVNHLVEAKKEMSIIGTEKNKAFQYLSNPNNIEAELSKLDYKSFLGKGPNDTLDLIDLLQQQVKELQEGNKAACESREAAVRSMRETCVTSNQHYAKVVDLVDQLAEKDRTIAALELESKGHKALKGYAKILLSFIKPDGTPVDSYSFREIAKELRTTVTALGE